MEIYYCILQVNKTRVNLNGGDSDFTKIKNKAPRSDIWSFNSNPIVNKVAFSNDTFLFFLENFNTQNIKIWTVDMKKCIKCILWINSDDLLYSNNIGELYKFNTVSKASEVYIYFILVSSETYLQLYLSNDTGK